MKKSTLIAAAFLVGTLCLTPSCRKESVASGDGTLSISIEGLVQPDTKAGGYETVQACESAVRTLEILVFSSGSTDAASLLELYHPCTAQEISAMSATLSLKTGDRKVWVVSNGPKDGSGALKAGKVNTLADLKAIAVDLSDNAVSGDGAGFVAFGGKDVAASETTASITIARLATRVALRKVSCNLPSAYSSITIKRAWIANVVGNQNLAGTASPATFYNRQSRADKTAQVSTEIIDGSANKASCPSLTYCELNQDVSNGASHTPATPKLFYAYANPSTVDPNGFAAAYAQQKTTLVLAVEVAGAGLYYYPIVLPDGLESSTKLGANTAYTVDLNIVSLGEEEPNKPVSKTAVKADVTLAPWVGATPYTETI